MLYPILDFSLHCSASAKCGLGFIHSPPRLQWCETISKCDDMHAPKVFDPDRVAREAPDWMNEMIKLHSEANGKDYWRELLWLTMKEIISEPNYSPADLARVDRPTLVIMGAEDSVNAPDEHAQYIANNIPNAELWIPEKIGHNVHLERREEWIAKVLDFLERRG